MPAWRCVIASLCAEGTSTIGNISEIDRGYERIDERLRSLGASIERVYLATSGTGYAQAMGGAQTGVRVELAAEVLRRSRPGCPCSTISSASSPAAAGCAHARGRARQRRRGGRGRRPCARRRARRAAARRAARRAAAGRSLPADEALAGVVVEVSERPLLVVERRLLGPARRRARAATSSRASSSELAKAAGLNVHVRLLEGKDPQHVLAGDLQGARRGDRPGVPTRRKEERSVSKEVFAPKRRRRRSRARRTPRRSRRTASCSCRASSRSSPAPRSSSPAASRSRPSRSSRTCARSSRRRARRSTGS